MYIYYIIKNWKNQRDNDEAISSLFGYRDDRCYFEKLKALNNYDLYYMVELRYNVDNIVDRVVSQPEFANRIKSIIHSGNTVYGYKIDEHGDLVEDHETLSNIPNPPYILKGTIEGDGKCEYELQLNIGNGIYSGYEIFSESYIKALINSGIAIKNLWLNIDGEVECSYI